MLKKLHIVVVSFLLLSSLYAKDKQWMLEDSVKVSEEYVKAVMRVFNQTVVYKHPTSWPLNPVYRKQTRNHFITEYIPKNQTLKNWKDMFTIQGYKNYASKGMTSIKMLNLLKQNMQSISPGKFYYNEVYRGDFSGNSLIISLMGIKKLPKTIMPELPKGSGEIGLYLVLKGKNDIYIIHRSWKGKPYSDKKLPMSKKELSKWIELLKEVSLS